jgi:hypothetical protein
MFQAVKAKLVLAWGSGRFGLGTSFRFLSSFDECEKAHAGGPSRGRR